MGSVHEVRFPGGVCWILSEIEYFDNYDVFSCLFCEYIVISCIVVKGI